MLYNKSTIRFVLSLLSNYHLANNNTISINKSIYIIHTINKPPEDTPMIKTAPYTLLINHFLIPLVLVLLSLLLLHPNAMLGVKRRFLGVRRRHLVGTRCITYYDSRFIIIDYQVVRYHFNYAKFEINNSVR